MLNLKAPCAPSLAARAALALAGRDASADAATTTHGGLETAAVDASQVAAGWPTALAGNPVQWSNDPPTGSHSALLRAGLAPAGALARRRRA